MKAIAMKCTKEQYDSVKSKLPKHDELSGFGFYPYLTNNFEGRPGAIGNTEHTKFAKRKVYKKWDEEIFLDACSIPTMTKEKAEEKYGIKII